VKEKIFGDSDTSSCHEYDDPDEERKNARVYMCTCIMRISDISHVCVYDILCICVCMCACVRTRDSHAPKRNVLRNVLRPMTKRN